MIWTDEIPYFTRKELDCKGSRKLDANGNPIPGTGVICLNVQFAALLPALRVNHGGPLHPNSVCRTPAHNKAEGGHPRSLHLTENPKHPIRGCAAADIAWRQWSVEEKLRFARLAWRMGFSVGLHNGFCHVDLRTVAGLPQGVFLYGAWSGWFTPDEVTE